MIATLAQATVPKFYVVVRKAFGGGIYVTSGAGLADRIFSFPRAVTGPFPVESIREPKTPEEKVGFQEISNLENPQRLVEEGHVDQVVEWSNLRNILCDSLKKETRVRTTPKPVQSI